MGVEGWQIFQVFYDAVPQNAVGDLLEQTPESD